MSYEIELEFIFNNMISEKERVVKVWNANDRKKW
jgi:hypothetical protein